MSFGLTQKQYEFLLHDGARINFLTGSVRSGKTYVSLLKWGLWVSQQSRDKEFLMAGKTITSLKRNCFGYLQELFGDNFKFTTSTKTAYLFGRLVYLEGANDERAEQKIRGMTLAGAYCDEVTLFPESFFKMLLSRLSVDGAKLWATCNPDDPSHYIKTEYIDKADSMSLKVWNFILTENIFLPKEYIDNISKEYSGVFYNRFILGQWVRAEGLCYPQFANNVEEYILPDYFDFDELIKITIGVDFGGNKSGTTFVCLGFTKMMKDVIVLEAEKHEEALDPVALDNLFKDFVLLCTGKYRRICYSYADSAEQILIRGLRNTIMKHMLQTNLNNSLKMPILDRIFLFNRLIGQHRFWVQKHCKTVIKALCEAVWNDKKENERLDDFTSDIDTLDAMEYAAERDYKILLDYSVA